MFNGEIKFLICVEDETDWEKVSRTQKDEDKLEEAVSHQPGSHPDERGLLLVRFR